MERNKIKDIFIEILIDKLNIDESVCVDEANLIQDLGADSLDIVDIIMQIEKAFNIFIPAKVECNLNTVGDFINIIEELTN